MLIFDIETEGLDEATVLASAGEFQTPPHPGVFDASAVKTGNLKDQFKIDAKIAEARAAHESAVAAYERTVEQARQTWVAEALDKAPLSPVTGRVLAIGYHSAVKGTSIIHDGGPDRDESTILAEFWNQYKRMRSSNRHMVGCNIFGFDLPFLIRRSWILAVEVPSTLRTDYRWWDKTFVDLRDVWLLGQKWGDCPSNLDHMARALGCGGKPDDCDGASFAKLWRGTLEEHQRARQYLLNDLAMTAGVAERLGVI